MSSETLPLYERESLLREAWANLRSLARFRELLRHLVRTSLAKETTGRVFGAVWWLLDPILLAAVFIFFVDVILRSGGVENYALFVLIGVTVWKYFQSGVSSGIVNTLVHQHLMRQVAFPKSVIPLAAVVADTLHFFIALGMFVLIAIPFGVYPNLLYLLLPLVVGIQLALTLGVAFALSALNIFFRDIQNLTGYLLRLGFFMSPALYPVPRIPEDYRSLYELNPFATILPAYHSILLEGELHNGWQLGMVGLLSAVLLVSGYLLFIRLERSFTKVD